MGLFKDVAPFTLPFVGPTVAAGADYYFNRRENEKQRSHEQQINEQNAQLQREFAQQGIRWRVADAEAAGLHPLAAIGATGASVSPSYQVGETDRSRSDFARSMGQNITRAISATRTAEERDFAVERLRGERLNNDLLGLQVKKAMMDLNPGPAFPTYGMYGNPLNLVGGADALMGRSDPVQANVEIPPVSDVTFAVTRTGLRPEPSRQLAQANQNSVVSALGWDINNKAVPMLTGIGPGSPPDIRRYPLPKGSNYYRWNRWAGEWQPARDPNRKQSWWKGQKENWEFGNRR